MTVSVSDDEMKTALAVIDGQSSALTRSQGDVDQAKGIWLRLLEEAERNGVECRIAALAGCLGVAELLRMAKERADAED